MNSRWNCIYRNALYCGPGEAGDVQHQSRSETRYVLGNDPEELRRLDHQAASIERPTRLLLQAATLQPGTRVLDLGTGLGHVARIIADLVGPTGAVVGIDQSAAAIAV